MAFEPTVPVTDPAAPPPPEDQVCANCKWWNDTDFNPSVCQVMPRIWAGDTWQYPAAKPTDRCHLWEAI